MQMRLQILHLEEDFIFTNDSKMGYDMTNAIW
jgi:hypothetical protein